MLPKDFIKNVLIGELENIYLAHPYISFALMAIGIEFLGKCLNKFDDWNKSNRSKKDFELAINSLSSFSSYRPILKEYDLWDSFRNGFAHSFVPKHTLSLSSGDEAIHFLKTNDRVINLRCEDLFSDYKKACLEVIRMTDFKSGKMNRDLLSIPKNKTA